MPLKIASVLVALCCLVGSANARVIKDPNDKSLPYFKPDVPGQIAYLQCKPGEYAVVEEIVAPKGNYALVPDPECRNEAEVTNTIGDIAKILAEYKSGNYTGAASTVLANKDVYRGLEGTVGAQKAAEIDRLLGGSKGRKAASCQPLTVFVQPGATITRYAVMALNPSNTWLKCDFGGADKCGKAWMSFPGPSYILTGNKEKGQSFTVIFKNWKHDWERHARLVVFFKLPQGSDLIEVAE